MLTSSSIPVPILQTAFAFWSSKVLLTAVEFGVFTKLGDRRLTGAELGAELGLHPRGISDFFDALVAMKFLDREGDGPAAKYFNTPAGALYLDQQQPALRRRHSGHAQRAALQVLARPARGLAHRQAAERNQARPEGNVRGALRGTAEARTVHGRDDRPLADQLRGVRGKVRFFKVQDALRHRRRDRPALHRSREETSASPVHVASICRRSNRSRRSTSRPPG